MVGPFIDPETGKPNTSPDFTADWHRKQYNSVFAVPRPEWQVDNFTEHFKEVVGTTYSMILSLLSTQADIQQACAPLKGTAATGPDGVPAILLKTCRNELARPLCALWRSSLDTGIIPTELLLVLICPIHKGGRRSRVIPKNYRLVVLTSHQIKVFERVLREALVSHIERLGLLLDGQHGSHAP